MSRELYYTIASQAGYCGYPHRGEQVFKTLESAIKKAVRIRKNEIITACAIFEFSREENKTKLERVIHVQK